MALTPPKKVLIIGGSLTSLMHALVLLTHLPPPLSTTIKILERNPTSLLHNQGAGVVADTHVQSFFDTYVCPGREIAVTSQQRLYLDKAGKVVEGSVDVRRQKMVGWEVLYRLLRHRVDGLDGSEFLTAEEQGRVGEVLRVADGVGTTSEGKSESSDGKGSAEYVNGCTVRSVEDAGQEGVRVKWTTKDGTEMEDLADLVFAADGASSAIRKQFLPQVERTYVGYVAWRGTVPEASLSDAAKDAFVEKFAFFHTEGIQILAYTIPGPQGTLEKGKRLVNWVWYNNYPTDSPELDELMTDKDGRRHHLTLPVGGMKDSVWEQQKKYAGQVLPPQYAELVGKTEQPFVQEITDVISPTNEFLGGKVLLVGDALAGFRPHTAASTGQAAYDALTLAELLEGKIGREGYNERVMGFAREVQRQGVVLGERSQFGRHPFAG